MRAVLLVLLVFFCGCTSSFTQDFLTVSSKYDAIVFSDGIDSAEAEIIAQRELVRKNLARVYGLSSPKKVTDVEDLPNHQDYWFISFKERNFKSIEYVFMTIIDRKTGKVKFADDYQLGKRWILEAVLLGGRHWD